MHTLCVFAGHKDTFKGPDMFINVSDWSIEENNNTAERDRTVKVKQDNGELADEKIKKTVAT